MVRSRVANVSSYKSAKVSLNLLDTIQNYRAEEQVAGVGCLFFLLCEQLRIDPIDLYGMSKRIIEFRDTNEQIEFEAVRNFITHEIKTKV